MERGSDKHSPRVDEQLEREVEALTHGAPGESRTEGRAKEDSAGPATRPEVDEATGTGLSEPQLRDRAHLASVLGDVRFPVTAEVLVAAAEEAHASPSVIERLAQLPRGRVYEALGEVWRGLGGDVEGS